MTPAGEVFNALRALSNDPAPLPEAYAEVLFDWLKSCHQDLCDVGAAADMYGTDPLGLVDEPDSVKHALRFARVVLGAGEATTP